VPTDNAAFESSTSSKMSSNDYVMPKVGCEFLPRFQTRPRASATILGLDVARKDLGLKAPAKWKKVPNRLVSVATTGQIQRGMRRAPLCRTLPSIACCAAAYARHIKTIWNSGIPDDVSNTTPEPKNDLKGLLP
jgi:hypothetical protein